MQFGLYFFKVEKIFSKPQDIEFSTENEKLYILQTRDSPPKKGYIYSEVPVVIKGVVFKPPGKPVAEKYVLVIDKARPDYAIYLKNAIAVIVDKGSVLCHFAILCRHLGIPYVVLPGIYNKVKNGEFITIKPNQPTLSNQLGNFGVIRYIPPQPEIMIKDKEFIEKLPLAIGERFELKVTIKEDSLLVPKDSLLKFLNSIIKDPKNFIEFISKLNVRQKAIIASLVAEPIFRYLVKKYGIYTISSSLMDTIPLYLKLQGNEAYLEKFGLRGKIKNLKSLLPEKKIKEQVYIKIEKKDNLLLKLLKELLTSYEEKDLIV